MKLSKRKGLGLVGCVLLMMGCHDDESAAPVSVRVIVTSRAVEVFADQHGQCDSTGSFRDNMGCRELDWSVSPVELCPAYTCIREFRLERDTTVLARNSQSSTFAALDLSSPLELGTKLVLEGCDGTVGFELPAPRTDGQPQISFADRQIVVSDPGATAIFASAASLPGMGQGYVAACGQSSQQVTLPTSDKYGTYSVEAFGLGSPIIQQQSFIRAQLFPAAYELKAVSSSVDLGSVWQVASEAARLSSLYEPCNSYCAAWNAACAQSTDDTSDCAAGCAINGEIFQPCKTQYQALISCLGQSPICNPRLMESVASACPEANSAWEDCARR